MTGGVSNRGCEEPGVRELYWTKEWINVIITLSLRGNGCHEKL